MARFYRKVIRIRAEDSPNVRFAMAQRAAGLEPTGETVLEGVLPWADYVKRRQVWDAIQQCVSLDARFYVGKEVMLYPPDWLDRAGRIAAENARLSRKAKGVGVDPAMGGCDTAWSAVDELGLIELIWEQTPDTNVIPDRTLAFMQKHGCEPSRCIFDLGGGGKQHVDVLRARGYPVRGVGFGEGVVLDPQRGKVVLKQKLEHREERYTYKNRRAQMYGELRLLLDPSSGGKFGIPAEYLKLRQELAPIPLLYDNEGRMRLLPKTSKEGECAEDTLIGLIGWSPDRADALVLGVHGMLHRSMRRTAGAM